LALFLYADSSGQRTVAQYAGIRALSLPSAARLVLVGKPVVASHPAPRLVVSESGYSPGWAGPAGSVRVKLDGLRNGWLGGHGPARADYAYAGWDEAAFIISLVTLVLVGAVGLALFARIDCSMHRLTRRPR
jgi:hypothetical protein